MVADFVAEISLEELERDPYPVYARLRAEAPVAWIPSAGVWFVTRFDDCALVGAGELGFGGATHHPTLQRVFGEPNILTTTGEQHDALRGGVDHTLRPGPIAQLVEDLVRPVARERLNRLSGVDHADLTTSYFEPVSVEALRSVLGMQDLVEADTLRRWFHDLNVSVSNFGQDPDLWEPGDRASSEIESVLRPLLDRLARTPDDSMISHMMWVGTEPGRPRPVEQLLPSLKVILLGGMQEPGHAASSSLLGLLQNPDQLEEVYREPESMIPLAVHEGLRWIAPIGAVERQSTRPVTLGGAEIPAGEIVMTILGSANRDESRFTDPDAFDMHRSQRRHMAFGNGEHFCAGHYFGRQVERIMFEELIATLPGLELDPESSPEIAGWVFRAPQSLPVRWSRGKVRESVSVARPRELVVSAMQREADDVVSLELRAAPGVALPGWTAGAHIDLTLVPSHVSHYSLFGDPEDSSCYRVAVALDRDGRGGSRFVHEQLRVGEAIPWGGVRNTFELRGSGPVVLVAGGIGVVPLVPLAQQALAEGRQVRFHYSGRTRSRMAFLDLLGSLPIELVVHAGDEPGGRVRLGDVADEAASAGATIYACGPARMLEELERLCPASDVPLVVERFAPGEAHREGDRPFAVRLHRSGGSVQVPAGSTILDALAAAGLEVASSCREGNCGTCETLVLGGTVDHRDMLLTETQRRAGDRMMLCVSRAAGDELVLDL